MYETFSFYYFFIILTHKHYKYKSNITFLVHVILGTGFPSASQFNLIKESFFVSILPPDVTDLILDGTETYNITLYYVCTYRFIADGSWTLFKKKIVVYKLILCFLYRLKLFKLSITMSVLVYIFEINIPNTNVNVLHCSATVKIVSTVDMDHETQWIAESRNLNF